MRSQRWPMCEWSSDYGYDSQTFQDLWRRARKQHKCEECSGIIHPGANYRFVSGRSEGEIWQAKICAACDETRNRFADEHKGERPLLGELDEALRECVADETSWDDDDNEVVTEAGKRWQQALDEMRARGAK